MRPTDERPNRLPLPPLILAGLAILALLLDSFAPLPFPRGVAADILQGAGFFAILLAICLYFFAVRELTRHKTTAMPHRAAKTLVTTGPFSLSRNPIYLANAILLTGWGLLAGNVWMLGAALLCGALEHFFVVRREEAHLEHKFGKAWRDYRKRVRRWV
jgi:protein-S-isoprenylcysteine O-methyltransferase Ste14